MSSTRRISLNHPVPLFCLSPYIPSIEIPTTRPTCQTPAPNTCSAIASHVTGRPSATLLRKGNWKRGADWCGLGRLPCFARHEIHAHDSTESPFSAKQRTAPPPLSHPPRAIDKDGVSTNQPPQSSEVDVIRPSDGPAATPDRSHPHQAQVPGRRRRRRRCRARPAARADQG